MFISVIEVLPVNMVQLLLANIMIFTVLCIFHLPSNRQLAPLFVFQAMVCIVNVLEGGHITARYYLVSPIFILAFGPILYLFVRNLVNAQKLAIKQIIPHFILAGIALPFTVYTQTIIALGSLSQIIYLILCFKLLTRYQISSHGARSDASSLQLSWMFSALIIFTILMGTDLIRMNVQTLVFDDRKKVWYFVNESLVFLIFSFLAFKVITKPAFFEGMTEYEQLIEQTDSPHEDNDQAFAEQLFAAIDREIIKHKLFTKPRLSISDLSAITGLKLKDISWAINKVAKRNFNDYINYLRVLEVKKNLKDDMSSSNILDIALLCGFNSKSSFNAVFKREVGMTPSQYLKKLHTNKVQS